MSLFAGGKESPLTLSSGQLSGPTGSEGTNEESKEIEEGERWYDAESTRDIHRRLSDDEHPLEYAVEEGSKTDDSDLEIVALLNEIKDIVEKNNEEPNPEPPKRTRSRRFGWYNVFLFTMDFFMLTLSILFPLFLRSKLQTQAATETSLPPITSQEASHRAHQHNTPLYFAHPTPPFVFPRVRLRGSGGGLAVVEFPDGDLRKLKLLVARYDVVIVMYYAHWDADSLEAGSEFLASAFASTSLTTIGVVRFAAINCRARESSCRRKARNLDVFPTVFGYVGGEPEFKGYIYEGPDVKDGYLTFLDRLLHPYGRLETSDDLDDEVATRDTVVLAHLGVYSAPLADDDLGSGDFSPVGNDQSSPAPSKPVRESPPIYSPLLHSPLRLFHRAALHFVQSPHHASFRFLVVSSPSLAKSLELGINRIRIYRVGNETLEMNVTFSSTSFSVSSSAFIAKIAKAASPSTVTLVRRDASNGRNSLHHLVKKYANVSVLMVGPDPRLSASTFNSFYAEFRETALWFRACNDTYHNSFRHVLRSSLVRLKAQRFCCDSLRPTESRDRRSFFKSPYHSMSNDDCKSQSHFVESSTYFGSFLNSSTMSCASERPHPLQETPSRRRGPFCRLYEKYPSTCFPRLAKNSADVVEDSPLAVAGLAGLECHFNRTVGFHYVVADDFQLLREHFNRGVLTRVAPDSPPFVVILDSDSEISYVSPRFQRSKELGEFVKDFTTQRLAPFRDNGRHRPSTPLCPGNVSDPCVLEVTASSLSGLLADSHRQLLLLFYSQSCGLCRVYNRYLLRLSELFRNVADRLVVGRVDVDANDLPWNLTFERVPVLLLMSGQLSVRFPFEAELSLPSLLNFILRHLTDGDTRRRLASRLCDAKCARRNLEDVRRLAGQLTSRRDRLVIEMLRIRSRVEALEERTREQASGCAEATSEVLRVACALVMKATRQEVQLFAQRLDILAMKLNDVESRMMTAEKLEAKIQDALRI